MARNKELILDIVLNSCEHPSADRIFALARERNPGIVLATIYNNLGALVNEGRIRRLTMPQGPERYDKPIRHDHAVCDMCGGVTDIFVDDLSRKLKKTLGQDILSYELNVHYICPECRQN